MRILVNLGGSETREKLMHEVNSRNSIWPGKSYATYPVDGATPEKLATELSAVWHGQATAMDAVRLFFGPDIPNVISNLLGTYYLIHVLGLTTNQAEDFFGCNSGAYNLGIARQSWLANSGDRDALKQMWLKGSVDWEEVNNFTSDYLSFWQKYYDIFGGRRKGDIKFLAECGFDAVYRWLYIFQSGNIYYGVILNSLYNDIVRIK